MTTEDRLLHDVKNGINRQISDRAQSHPDAAKILAYWRGDLANDIIDELRIRWTLIERPRKQRTLRQES